MKTAAIYCRVTDKRESQREAKPLGEIPLSPPLAKGEDFSLSQRESERDLNKERGIKGVRLVTKSSLSRR